MYIKRSRDLQFIILKLSIEKREFYVYNLSQRRILIITSHFLYQIRYRVLGYDFYQSTISCNHMVRFIKLRKSHMLFHKRNFKFTRIIAYKRYMQIRIYNSTQSKYSNCIYNIIQKVFTSHVVSLKTDILSQSRYVICNN